MTNKKILKSFKQPPCQWKVQLENSVLRNPIFFRMGSANPCPCRWQASELKEIHMLRRALSLVLLSKRKARLVAFCDNL